MAHDVFISYATEDKIIADAVCAGLEKAGIRCWIAPRDILTSENYDDAIIRAINSSKVMVVIFSSYIFQSQFVKSEVERAFSKGLIIAPFRIENIDPQGGLELYLGRRHWLDAMTPPLENHIQTLVTSIQPMLAAAAAAPVKPASMPVPVAPAAASPLSRPQPPAAKARRPTGLVIALAVGAGLMGILCLVVVAFWVGKNAIGALSKTIATSPAAATQSFPGESPVPTPLLAAPTEHSAANTPISPPTQAAQPGGATPAALPGGNWLYLGDLPRSINAFVVDPANPKIVYAASGDYTGAGGGVYKSEDAGLSWHSASSGLPNRTAQALVFVPGASPALLAAVGSDIYTSTDGAANWTKTGNTGTFGGNDTSMFAVSGDAKTVFAVVNYRGIASSDDGGQSWMTLNEGLPQDDTRVLVLSVAVDLANPTILYAGTGGFVGQGQGVFKSTDGGQTWSPANRGMLDFRITALAVDPRQPQVVYAGSERGDLLKSSDGAQTWTNLSDRIKLKQNVGSDVRNILIDPATSTVYLLANYTGVIYSSDGGAKWHPLGTPPGGCSPQFNSMAIVFGDSPLVFTSTPGNAGDLAGGWRYAAGQPAPVATPTLAPAASGTDKTVLLSGHWQAALELPRVINMLAISPANPKLVFATAGDYSNPGGVYKSEDGGLTWQATSQGLPNKGAGQLAFAAGSSPGLLAAIGSDIYASRDNAVTWSKVGSVGSGGGLEVKMFAASADRQTTFAVLAYGCISRSEDGGQSWLPLACDGLPVDTYPLVQSVAVDPTNTSLLYAGTGGFVRQGQGVFKSIDGGDTWVPANRGMLDYKIITLAINPLQPQEIYAGSEDGNLFKSSDGGQAWTNLTERLKLQQNAEPRAIRSIQIDPLSGVVYLLGDNSGVLYSGDGGAKWRMLGIPSGLNQPRFSSMAVFFGEKPVILTSVMDSDQPVFRFASN